MEPGGPLLPLELLKLVVAAALELDGDCAVLLPALARLNRATYAYVEEIWPQIARRQMQIWPEGNRSLFSLDELAVILQPWHEHRWAAAPHTWPAVGHGKGRLGFGAVHIITKDTTAIRCLQCTKPCSHVWAGKGLVSRTEKIEARVGRFYVEWRVHGGRVYRVSCVKDSRGHYATDKAASARRAARVIEKIFPELAGAFECVASCAGDL
jgi:hypothetical protein